jgi:hypothetical protein
MTHYLSTGERPHGRDWFYPKGPDGQRRSILTYLPRLVSAYLHPVRTVVGISNPLNVILGRLFVTNEAWSGEVIRQPGDPWFRQAWDALKFVGSEGYQPFVAQNVKRGEGAVESVMGVSPAAAEWQKSDAENYLHDVMPQFSKTHEEAARLEVRRDLRTAIQQKSTAGIAAAKQTGELSSRSVRQAFRTAHQDSLMRAFLAATLPQATHAYELATPEERLELRPAFSKKAYNQAKVLPPAERASTMAAFQAAMKLPVAKSVVTATR